MSINEGRGCGGAGRGSAGGRGGDRGRSDGVPPRGRGGKCDMPLTDDAAMKCPLDYQELVPTGGV